MPTANPGSWAASNITVIGVPARPCRNQLVALRDFEPATRKQIREAHRRLSRDELGKRAKSFAKESPNHVKTGIAGTVLRLNDKPLAGVTVTAGGQNVETDATGRFELTDLAPGHYELAVDGRTAKREYLHVVFGVDVAKDELTELTHAVYLPMVRKSDWVSLNAPADADTVVQYPKIPVWKSISPRARYFAT